MFKFVTFNDTNLSHERSHKITQESKTVTKTRCFFHVQLEPRGSEGFSLMLAVYVDGFLALASMTMDIFNHFHVLLTATPLT